jgi:hypothetical protein
MDTGPGRSAGGRDQRDPRDQDAGGGPPWPRAPLGLRTPEQLAREFEERAVEAQRRDAAWLRRRFRFRCWAVAIGACGPAAALTLCGGIARGTVWAWLAHGPGWPLMAAAACGGGLAGLLVAVRGWGIARGMMVFGALFSLGVGFGAMALIELLPAMPGLVSACVAIGGVVGYVTVLEEDG